VQLLLVVLVDILVVKWVVDQVHLAAIQLHQLLMIGIGYSLPSGMNYADLVAQKWWNQLQQVQCLEICLCKA
jgi:nucleoside phosphorylase